MHYFIALFFLYFYNKDNNQLINTWWAEHFTTRENLLWEDNQFLWAEMTLKKKKKEEHSKKRKKK